MPSAVKLFDAVSIVSPFTSSCRLRPCVSVPDVQPEQIPGILAGCDRSQAGPTLPAKGLFLKCVEYPDMKENHS